MKKKAKCCGDGKFPTFSVIVLIFAVIWLLNDLKVFSTDLPWVPIIVMVIAVGWIINHYHKK